MGVGKLWYLFLDDKSIILTKNTYLRSLTCLSIDN
jgi:hypothetical protein